MAVCSGCGAEIIWARTMNGRRIPVDAAPSPDGNVVLGPPSPMGPLAKVLGKLERDALAALEGAKLHKTHFATCPEVARFRAKKETKNA